MSCLWFHFWVSRFSPENIPSTSRNVNISQNYSKRKAGESVLFQSPNESRKMKKENYVSSAAWSTPSTSSHSFFMEDFSMPDDLGIESSKKQSFKKNPHIMGKSVSTTGSNKNVTRTFPSPSVSTSSVKMSQPSSTVTLKTIADKAVKVHILPLNINLTYFCITSF